MRCGNSSQVDDPQRFRLSCNVQGLLNDLKSCSIKRDVQWGRGLHANAVEIGHASNIYVQTALIRMYAKCGSMENARCVFDGIQNLNVVSWNVLLLGYAENGEGCVTLELFITMKSRGCSPSSRTYLAAVKACTYLAVNGNDSERGYCLERSREIHSEIGHHLDHYLQNALIETYAKCGDMGEAQRIFDSIQKPDVVSWSALLLGYAEHGEGLVALEVFSKMKARGCAADSITYVAVLKACMSLAINENGNALERGRQIHAEIGCHLDRYLQNMLIEMYAKCGSINEALSVFDSIQTPDVVSWNALLLGYAENGKEHATLDLFSTMKARGCAPDSVTYVAALKACTSLAMLEDSSGKGDYLALGREIHFEIGGHLNHYVQCTLIDMYANIGSMVDARCVFDSIDRPDVVSWNALLLGYADNGEAHFVLDLFIRMKVCGCVPDPISYVAVLKSCCLIGALALGRKFQSEMTEFTSHVVTCLVDLYAKCGSIAEAHQVFNLHSKARGVGTWNALLAGYSSFGDCYSVFKLFKAMRDEGFCPDAVTFVCLLLCCSHAGLAQRAKEYIETMPVQYGVTPSVVHYNCVVDVLGRANRLNEAISVVQRMPCNPNAVTWRALLGACRKWKNVEIGRMVFRCLDHKDSSAYVLMAHIYGSRGMWEEQEKVLALPRFSCL